MFSSFYSKKIHESIFELIAKDEKLVFENFIVRVTTF